MAMKPRYKPDNPFFGAVNGMFVGKSIYVCGKSYQNANRFAINLFCGPNTDDDIALTINPRFPVGQIVRGIREAGRWGQEQRDGPGFPFKQGDLFGITITCRVDGYEIRANSFTQYPIFRHRIPFQSVSHVGVSQDCDIILVASMIEGLDVPLYVVSSPQNQVEIPFQNIRERTVVILGTPTNGNTRFSINFMDPAAEINHLQINPRLHEKTIVRNSDNDGWGKEERELGMAFPFVQGAPFQVAVTVNEKQFVVKINGLQAFTYKRREESLKDIRLITFIGDVEIENVTFY